MAVLRAQVGWRRKLSGCYNFAVARFRGQSEFDDLRRVIAGHIPAKELVPPEMGLSENGYFRDGYQEQANSLLLDALLELDLTLVNLEPIKISYSSSERNALIAQAIQKQWQEGLKIKVELEAVEPKIFFQRVISPINQAIVAAAPWI